MAAALTLCLTQPDIPLSQRRANCFDPAARSFPSELGRGGHNALLAAGAPAARTLGRRKVAFPFPQANAALAAHLRNLMSSGAYRPVIDRRYPFEEIRQAYAYVDSGRKVGNVVITMPS
ncbi:MAG: zinc-binding dehydrogenase [Ornithinimicrobium sp.]